MNPHARRIVEFFLALPLAVAVNARRVRVEHPRGELPDTIFFLQERDSLLTRSEARLQSIETKATGVATVTSIVTAGIALAIVSAWDSSGAGLRFLLVISGLYAVVSLVAPLLLLGPVSRSTIVHSTLVEAAKGKKAEVELAKEKSLAAAHNAAQALRSSNLLSASRDGLLVALLALLLWAILAAFGVGFRSA
jgi:hypothetical protein